jgi:tripartite-type tricarboxylate transporter receptor subunit TctC
MIPFRHSGEGRNPGSGRSSRGIWIASLAVIAGLAVGEAIAQGYPSRALRIVVPSSAASGADFTARLVAGPLGERLGQQVVVENRAGAATMIGTELVAKSPPDGYTLLLAVGTLATVPAMYKKVPYDALRDFAPITQLVSVTNVLIVHPSLPARSVKELVALAKSRPGDIAFASSGTGTLPHLSMELLLITTGTKMLHVPYKGPAPALFDLVSGRVSAMMTSTGASFPHIRSGRVRVLGVTATRRIAMLPEVPTIAEAGVPGYESVQWWGLLVPAGTPAEIITRLHKEAVAVMTLPDIRERVEKEGMTVVAGSPQAFGAYIRSEIEKWAKIVKSAGIQPE